MIDHPAFEVDAPRFRVTSGGAKPCDEVSHKERGPRDR
jgi:hypothetical protein